MTRPRPRLGRRALAALVLSLACSLAVVAADNALASGISIQYQVFDLQDEAPGEDLWLYRYAVGGFDYGPGHGVSVLFDPSLYRALSLEGVAGAPAGWDAIALQPDPLLSADGLYDALAQSTPSGWSGPFEVAFVWLGAGDPGDQDFVVYDERFATIESGRTVIPEPAAAVLVLLGLALLGVRGRAIAAGRASQAPIR